MSDFDYDKDDIMDLLKMKILQNEKSKQIFDENKEYIRRISLDPFMITFFSGDQFTSLNLINDRHDDEDITLQHSVF